MENLFTYNLWDELVLKLGFLVLLVSLILLVWYKLRAATIAGRSAKYDYVASNELSYLKKIALTLAIGVGLVLFAVLAMQFHGKETILLYFVGAVSVGIAFLIGYALEEYFKVYYPFFLDRKLSKIRFEERKAPNGKPMKLLREHEEDVHMTAEMIAHEASFTYDYDVWLEPESGYKLIERYDGHLYAKVCPNCEFRTMRDFKEEIVKEPTEAENGLLKKHYHCSYCGHEEVREASIASAREEQEMLNNAVMA